MGFNTGMSEDDVEEIRREYEVEIGGLEKELAALRAENERLREALDSVVAEFWTGPADGDVMAKIAKEAMK